jgi:hypothetical protein
MSYITPTDVRKLYGTQDPPTDADIQAAIDIQQEHLENLTRNFFEARPLTLELDGDDTTTLLLPAPIISITNLFMNDDDNPVDPNVYVVYNGRQRPQDDRMNPKIAIKTQPRNNIFLRITHDLFRSGHRNQRVEGIFGFLEPDNTIPTPVTYALTKMVIRQLNQDYPVTSSGGTDSLAGVRDKIIKETTDGHSYELDAKSVENQSKGLTGDLEIDRIILRYRMPIIRMSSKWDG